ncbi:MAG: TIGR03936 family radical SAM-associated protein [Clostridia bacterium]|nr:TIGR03936 family radical SAM-associated protein [Clostridia bacterium]
MKTVRIFYEKRGRLKFVSHLDMTRFMSRLLAKSKIPVWYTEGFNQHIYMNFALPLSLGFEGLYEILEIRLTDDGYDLNKCLEALKGVAPPDIDFISVDEPVTAMKDIGFATFRLDFDEIDQGLAKSLTDFFESDSVICQKAGKKGKIKEFDIIPKICSYEINGNRLILVVVAGNEDNLNPTLIMNAFFEKTGISPPFYTVSRVAIMDKQGNLFR